MNKKKKIALVIHSGTVDKLLCAFTLGSTAAAMDMEVHLYFTFWGLNMLKRGAMEKAELSATHKHLEEMLKTKGESINTWTVNPVTTRKNAED